MVLRRFTALLAGVAMAALLSGCVDVQYRVALNADGSCDVAYRFLVNSVLTGLAAQTGSVNPLSSMEDSARASGYEISPLVEREKSGFLAKKHIVDLEAALAEGDPFGSLSTAFPFDLGNGIKIEKKFFETTYSLNSDVDLSAISLGGAGGAAGYAGQLTQTMIQSMRFAFVLQLPGRPESSNAASIEGGGTTLLWDLVPGRHNKIEASAKIPNTANYVLTGGVVILLLVMFARPRRRGAKR